jgi:hydroxyacylglutathione hydrolase
MIVFFMDKLRIIPLHVCYGSMKNYSYVLFNVDSKNAVIIDPAWEIQKYIDIFQLYKLTPCHILLTHAHHDHINLVEDFLKRYNVAVWISEREKGNLPFPRSYVRLFSHFEILPLNELTCTAFLTPGHTPGSSCFLVDSHLFSGDTLFIEGCGICLDPEGNPEDLYESIMFLKQTLSSEVKIYPGHRYQAYPGQTLDYVLKNNIYLHLENRNDFVKYRMRSNQRNLFDFK